MNSYEGCLSFPKAYTNVRRYQNVLVKALDGVTLEIEQGSFTAIVGTSGSGKSTLLNMLGGLDNPTSGSIVVDGQELNGMGRNELTIFRRRKIGFILPFEYDSPDNPGRKAGNEEMDSNHYGALLLASTSSYMRR